MPAPLGEMPKPLGDASGSNKDGPARVVGIRLDSKAPTFFQKTPFRIGIFVLFVAGLLSLIASTSHIK
jgi:hypothetical protein